MGLDACVFCNCYETGRIKCPPPDGVEVIVANDGSLDCKYEDVDVAIAFDSWMRDRACDHEDISELAACAIEVGKPIAF